MQRYKKIGIILILIIAGLIIGVNYVLSSHKAEIGERILASVNKHIIGEIQIDPENIDLTIFEDFPYVSVRLNDISIKGSLPDAKENLLDAKSVFLLFNFNDFINKKYDLLKLRFSEATIYLEIDSSGQMNYNIIKKDSTTLSTGFEIDLESVELNNTVFKFHNYTGVRASKGAKHQIETFIDLAHVGATITKEKIDLFFTSSMTSRMIRIKKENYFSDAELEVESAIQYDIASKELSFKPSNIILNEVPLHFEGKLEMGNKYPRINLELSSEKELSVGDVFELMPGLGLNFFKDIRLTGKVKPKVKIHGIIASWKQPVYDVDFKIRNGAYFLPDEQTLDQIKLCGHYSSANKNGSLKVDSLDFDFKGRSIKGEVLINDFKNPLINIDVTGELALDLVNSYVDPKLINVVNGEVDIEQLRAKVQFDNFQNMNLEQLNFNARLKIQGADLKINEFYSANNIDIDVQASNKALIVNSMTGELNGSKIEYDGIVYGLYQLVFDKINNPLAFNKINVTGSLDADKLLLSDFIANGNNDGLVLPDVLDFNVKAKVGNFKYRKVDVNSLAIKLKKENSYVSFSNVQFDGMGGQMNINGQMHQFESEDFYISLNVDAKEVKLDDLMYQMEDFRQTAISYKNLKGRLNSKCKIKFSFDPSFKVTTSSLMFDGDIFVKDGELLNFSPLLAMSKYISVDELKAIKFSNLENHIEIKNRVVHIPQMIILSSAMDLLISGTHSFDNDLDYKIRMKLSAILSKNKKVRKKEEYEFNEKGEGSLYITVQGNVDDPIVKYDRKAVRQKIKKDLKEEKGTLKEVIRTEFSNDKPVTKVKDDVIKENEIEFIDFDEDNED